MKILRKHGIKDENPLFEEIVRFFRALRSGKI
jgi:dipeptidyl aminopeptidase/acylaminoacyl peptidase